MNEDMKFIKALEKVFSELSEGETVDDIHITTNASGYVISKKKPKKEIVVVSTKFDVSSEKDKETGLWIWTY